MIKILKRIIIYLQPMLIFKENNKHNYKGITLKKNKFNIQCLITLEV